MAAKALLSCASLLTLPQAQMRGEAAEEGEEDNYKSLELKQPGGPKAEGDDHTDHTHASKSCTAPEKCLDPGGFW